MYSVRQTLREALPLCKGVLAVIERLVCDRQEALLDGTTGLRLIGCTLEGHQIIHAESALPVIGPHCGSRIPALFGGEPDPAPNGAASAAPWSLAHHEAEIRALFDARAGSAEAAIENQPFTLRVNTGWQHGDLVLNLSHMSETDSVIGLPLALHLPGGRGTVEARVLEGEGRDGQGWMRSPCDQKIDALFLPYPSPRGGSIRLETELYTLKIDYQSVCQEISWHLATAPGREWVTITPFTASHPSKPILSCNRLELRLALV